MDDTRAFSYDQILRYMGKIHRKMQIDRPGAVLNFITAKAGKRQRGLPDCLKEGQIGVIQAYIPGNGTRDLHRFKLAYDESLEKTWWIPEDRSTYSEFEYVGLDPL